MLQLYLISYCNYISHCFQVDSVRGELHVRDGQLPDVLPPLADEAEEAPRGDQPAAQGAQAVLHGRPRDSAAQDLFTGLPCCNIYKLTNNNTYLFYSLTTFNALLPCLYPVHIERSLFYSITV